MSNSVLLGVLLCSCALNAAADILLLNGARQTNWKPGLEALAKTPPRFVTIGALAGLVTIPPWFLLAVPLTRLDGTSGLIALISYCTYVAACLSFHLSYAFVAPAIRSNPDLIDGMGKLVAAVAGSSMVAATVFTLSLAWLAFTGTLNVSGVAWLSFLALTVVGFQVLAGALLGRLPFYLVISGNVAMAAFFFGFVELMDLSPALQP